MSDHKARYHVIFTVREGAEGRVMDFCRESQGDQGFVSLFRVPEDERAARVEEWAKAQLGTVERQCKPGTIAGYRIEHW